MGPLLFLVMLVPFTINGLAVREAFFVSFLGKLGVERRRRVRDRLPLLRRHDRARAAGRGDPRLGGAAAGTRPRPGLDHGSWLTSSSSIVTLNALPWIEQCLESLRGLETVVVDHGSTDGTRRARPRARSRRCGVIEQGNRGYGAGLNAGLPRGRRRATALINSDAWVVGDAVERLVAFADAHPDAAVVGPRLRNPDGTLQRSVRGFPTLWRLATEYFFLRKLAPRSHALNAFYAGGFDHDVGARRSTG